MASSSHYAALLALGLWASGCARPDAPERSLGTSSAMLTASRLTPLVETTAVERFNNHLLLTLRLGPDGTEVLDSREVDMPLPRERAPGEEAWRVLVEDKNGRPLFLAQQRAVQAPRAELESADGKIESARAPMTSRPTVAVRVPVLRGASVVRVFGLARTLGPDDPRAQGLGPDAMVELGRVAYPARGQ
ncbi:MAG TPA: hypothetical protein VK447_09225 [Myxococcaceae bacterium]|nr:hypothetical protein [Myxococcaceae bacterium]